MTQTIEQLTARVRELERAESTLIKAGYTDCGGELWKPPLGESASHLLERISELEEENARLKKLWGDATECAAIGITENDELKERLAASQAYAEQLRDSIVSLGNPWSANSVSISEAVKIAATLPRDTSALDAYVSEKVKEAMK